LPDEPLLGFVEIPAGSFVIGSDKKSDPQAYDGETPQHTLTLPGYYISHYPVTVAQFRAFVEQSGHKAENEESLKGPLNQPVVWITWYEALKYCEWLTKQLRDWKGTPEPLASLLRENGWQVALPSEAEWEKAARGTEGLIYPWGDEFSDDHANTSEMRIGRPSAVGSFPQGRSPYGCEDMAGNVWEWMRSLYGAYPYPHDQKGRVARENLDAPDRKARVLRGGSFLGDRWLTRCACRARLAPDLCRDDGGFRIVVRPCLSSDL